MGDPCLIEKFFLHFDKDNISERAIRLVQPYLERDDLNPENARKVSLFGYVVCVWIRAVCAYYRDCQTVKPLREQLNATFADDEMDRCRLEALNKRAQSTASSG